MRKWILALAALALLGAACAPEDTGGGGAPTGPTATGGGQMSAAECAAAHEADLFEPGKLTVGTGNPAFDPWWAGGTTDANPEWEFNDPYNFQGYEGAFLAAMAEALGFSTDDVVFVPVGFNKSFAPGPKDFDLVLQQISYSAERAQAVDLSDSYYDVNQALVSIKDSPISQATSIADLKDAKLGGQIGTTGLAYIEENIQPTEDPAVYEDLNGAIRDLQNGQIDGIVVDYPTGWFIGNVQIKGGVLVGQFPTVGEQEYFSVALEQGSPLTECVNLAIGELRADGTLDAIRQEWLEQVSEAPVLT
jgi:polar amino acid transport system substrate-binding protein